MAYKKKTTLTALDVYATYQDGSKLVATLKDIYGRPVKDVKVKIVVSNELIKYLRTDNNGQVALDLSRFEPGKYKATITFLATKSYEKSTTVAKIYINKD